MKGCFMFHGGVCFSDQRGFVFKWGAPHGRGIGFGVGGGGGFEKNRKMSLLY